MKIISISGLDGSGKSTQIEKLRAHFEKNGKKVLYFHAVQFSVAHVLNAGKKKNADGKTKDVSQASWGAIFLRKVALLIDVIRFRFFVKKVAKTHDYLLTDRYFYDIIVNISYLQKKTYHPFFFHWITVPDKRFFLSVNPEYIMMRDNPPAQGHDYLVAKNDLFHNAFNTYHLTVIDGSKYVDVVFADILQKIRN